jgi:hypothetical protein
MKTLKNKSKVTKIILTIILLIICISIYVLANSSPKEEEENEQLKEMKDFFGQGDLNEIIARVNGEDITQDEINRESWLESNSTSNDEEISQEEVLNNIIRNKVILQEAKKDNIEVSDEEKETVKRLIEKAYENDIELSNEVIKITNQTKEEYIKELIESEIERRTISLWHAKIIVEIMENKISIEDENFNKKLRELQNSDNDLSQGTKLLRQTYEAYVDYLVKNSSVDKNL